jgi:hypothetical protein
MQAVVVWKNRYLRVLPQCSEVVVKNDSCAGLPLPVFDDKRWVDHVKNDAKQQLQRVKARKVKNHGIDVRRYTYRSSQRVAKDSEVCRMASRGCESTTRMRKSRLGQIEDRWLDFIS